MQTRGKRIFLNVLSSIIVTIFMVMCFFSIMFAVFEICYTEKEVTGLSMYPTLNSTVSTTSEVGDTVYVNLYSSYTNGDIVVANASRWDLPGVTLIIKRVIGCPGDTVKIKEENGGYVVYVNEKPLYVDGEIYFKEKNTDTLSHYNAYKAFLENAEFSANVTTDGEGESCIVLNEGEYLLLGDNWGHSTDSLYKGSIKKSEILGRVDIVIEKSERNYWTLFKEIMTLFFVKN